MITIALQGGMGNQMFQRAYGLALEQRGYRVGYSKAMLIEGTHREFSLGPFGDLSLGDSQYPIAREPEGIKFYPNMLQPPPTCTIVGYWQSEKYFADIADIVRKTFALTRPLLHHPSPSIALHVRRQDYTVLQNFHGLPSLAYYLGAVDFIHSRKGHAKVFIVSDDPQWCRENFPADFEIVTGTTKYEDLQTMIDCTHVVTANSSFSWWGAWLGETPDNPNRIVVVPKRWYSSPSMADDAALIPERWIRQ